MLIEELIRLGRPVLDSGLDARQLLRLITDAADERVKNFYRHVIVVELPPTGSDGDPAVLPVQNWQVEQQVAGKKPEIDVDVERTVGVPFVIPSANPIYAQGRYIPVYPVWEKHFFQFRESVDGVFDFLTKRLRRTPRFSIEEASLKLIAEKLHKAFAAQDEPKENWLGVVILARCEPEGFFTYQYSASRARIGHSQLFPGRFIRPDDRRILEGFWAAKIEEGTEKGKREGPCSISGKGDTAISAYCKAWPWALPTWTCPVPHAGDTDRMIEGIALSEPSYRALTVGANIFHGLTCKLHRVVLPELFAPVENRDRENAARKRKKWPAEIFGAFFLLPWHDSLLADEFNRDDFARRLLAMLDTPTPAEPLADQYLTSVTGFDVFLPDELDRDDFRLTLVYFSRGKTSEADIHLRAYIQDVLPSTAGRLKKLVRPCREQMAELMRLLSPKASDERRAYLSTCYQSVPYLLTRGYGGSHLWTTLEQCLHRRPLDDRPVVAHVAARIRSVVPCWPKTRSDVGDEVIFLLVCRDFIHRYNREVADPPKEDAMPMRPWQELIRAYEREPIEAMEFRSVAELGFACGLVVRRFSVWYYSTQDKDFLKHRVLTFGTDLGPKDIQRGVTTIRSVAAKFDDLRRMVEVGQLAYYPKEERKQHMGDYQHRLGAVLNALNTFSGEVDKSRDEFVSGFWSGYCLQGYDRPRAAEVAPASTNGGEA